MWFHRFSSVASIISRAPSSLSQQMETNWTWAYLGSLAVVLSLSNASGQRVHLVVQKSIDRKEKWDNKKRQSFSATFAFAHVPITVSCPWNVSCVVSSSAVIKQVNGRFGRVLLQVVMLDCVACRKVADNEIVVENVMSRWCMWGKEWGRGARQNQVTFLVRNFWSAARFSHQWPTTINDASKFVSLENVHSESTFCDNEAIID